jgi:nitrite reductase/ring-hydroxylating ferredoxin subunit/alkylhydroperoxidase/carboxymuconolactone decarboxylase family protein YurZ
MSDALEYLVKARPEAMTAYFKFLKESGKHLDPKTRAIISVITKVDTGTEKGFKQYLSRALQVGVTANEVLDGLLQAFPTLGLAKIVWAVDILLQMDLPEFRTEYLDATAKWHDIAAESQLKEGTTYLKADGRSLFVHRANGEIRVYDSHCPHQTTDIPQLALEGQKLTCPKHHWAFDITSGECIELGNRPLKRFEHKLENGRLYARW